ncbi:hypothetical protein [Antarctobacter jejuensis]|uniref:hypothetical protein n=1 Tax=Antarctobacter jejuensis TaxID=1439938 RepID=UPI003FD51E72
MQFLVPPLLSAPQVTGHPQGLPRGRPDPLEQTRVKPISDARDPEARMKEGQSPTQFWSAVNGEPDPDNHTAPPSIMQITISRMLDEQISSHKAEAEVPPLGEAEPDADPDPAKDINTPDTRAQAANKEAADKEKDSARPEQRQLARPDQPFGSNALRNSVFSTLP